MCIPEPDPPSRDLSSKHSPLVRYTRNILRNVNRAVNEFSLISPGDRVCIALSGGKDSLGLLHLLEAHRRFFPIPFTISAAHVSSDFSVDREATVAYLSEVCAERGIPLSILPVTVTLDEAGNPCTPSCFWCSRVRREALFRHCVDEGHTRLALGHHFDDVAETTLLNLVYHGNLETMLPGRSFFDGKFDVIRPLFYLRERQLVHLASLAGYMTRTCTCHHADMGKRRLMKDLVRTLAHESRHLHHNLWRASRTWWDALGDRPCHPTPRDPLAE